MADEAKRLREAVVDRSVTGDGRTTVAERTAALTAQHAEPRVAALLDKVARNAYKVTDEDIAGAKAAGLTEDQIFELVIAATFGQANRQLASAVAALDAAFDEAEAAS